MKRERKTTRIRPSQAPRFDLTPIPLAPFRGTQETELERLKTQLLKEWLADVASPELLAPVRRASHEAAALAWTTPFPLLLLPELFHEKAATACRYVRKQAALRRGNGRNADRRATRFAGASVRDL